ncbi:MAG: hypothetical protein EPO24_05830 [Bacteroidetes bacterium]|nr:MAG: hypothetical protein EPO24_05830 [Bacteroidota bacterium]
MQLLIVLLMVSFINLFPGNDKPKPVENKHVTFKASIVETSLKAGMTGTLQLTLTPTKGIHINLDPPMNVIMDSSASIGNVEKLTIPKNEKTGYLDASKPVTLKFKLAANVKPGKLNLKGTFTYFYCSDAEGWCNRFKQPIDVTVTVSK